MKNLPIHILRKTVEMRLNAYIKTRASSGSKEDRDEVFRRAIEEFHSLHESLENLGGAPQTEPHEERAKLLLKELGLDWRLQMPLDEVYIPGIDPGIERAVLILRASGIETYESCEAGPGHCYPEPTVRFGGDKSEGFKALDIALKHGLPVSSLRRHWAITDGEPVGPEWEMVFWKKLEPICPA